MMRTLSFYIGTDNIVWAKYSLFEALDPLKLWDGIWTPWERNLEQGLSGNPSKPAEDQISLQSTLLQINMEVERGPF